MTNTHRYLEEKKSAYDVLGKDEQAIKAQAKTLEDLEEYLKLVNDFKDYKDDKNPDAVFSFEECMETYSLLETYKLELQQEKSIADQLAAMNAGVSKNSAKRAAREAAEAEAGLAR